MRLYSHQQSKEAFEKLLRRTCVCVSEWANLPSVAKSTYGTAADSEDDEVEVTAEKTLDEMLKEQFDEAKLSGRCSSVGLK